MNQPIHSTYDRLGRQVSAIVAGVSTNAYTYDQETLALVMETQNGMEITRTTDALGRDTGFSLGSDYSAQYGFDAYGRFSSVTSSVSSASLAVQYTRLADSDLLSGRSLEIGNSLLAVGYSYEPARSLITSVSNLVNHVNPVLISAYDYANDSLGRRTSIARSGLAFGDLPVRDAYGYNSRSEVTSARRTPVGSQTELRGFSYDYAYDPIGNRITSTEYDHEDNALESEYTANELNQYEQRSVPGYAGVRGTATNTAVVTVNGNPAWRLDEYFYGGDDADNSADAVMNQLEITAVQSNLYSAVTGRVFVAETPEAFTYDADGNLTQDGRFGYTWNGENRLIKAETRDDLPASVPRVRVKYAYDHQGRMAWKQISTNAVILSTRTLLWDGYNIVQAHTHSQTHTLTNYYIWGLDLSGSLQGAGGVGGLLAEVQDGVPYFAAFDANGNVTEYLAADGFLAAHYEYSPFGAIIVQSGDLAASFTHRFSTKPWCAVTGLSEYLFRKYSPKVGRWLNRDPIGRKGGVNLFCFISNKPNILIDRLGYKASCNTGFCCDRCDPNDKPIVTKTDVALKYWMAAGKPSTDEIALDVLGDTKWAQRLTDLGGVGAACAVPGWVSSVLLEVASSASSDQMTSGWTDGMVKAIKGIGETLMEKGGARIWIQLEWEKCEKETCWFIKKRYNWKNHKGWHRCVTGSVGEEVGFGIGMSEEQAAKEISAAVPGCIADAIEALVK